ncbi:hypothetical protein ACN42_g10482 [Penicillium freii]|uniref:Uncharacterized protein n=1 Tax=Penicillium freii TaxID=48697 RepID=A0A117NKW7_PENFR|nr:hypothetical protein ACN42_g10482 [Penicillium freii]
MYLQWTPYGGCTSAFSQVPGSCIPRGVEWKTVATWWFSRGTKHLEHWTTKHTILPFLWIQLSSPYLRIWTEFNVHNP